MPKQVMGDAQVMAALRSDTVLNRARARFGHHAASLEQAGQQRRAPSGVEVRRMEFEAVADIAGKLGFEVDLLAEPDRAVRLVVHQVEIWCPPAEDGGTIASDLMTVAATREAALAYVAAHPDAGRGQERWCWVVYGVEVGDPKGRPLDKVVLAQDGRECDSPAEAWEASFSSPAMGR